ncbi:uncharacterized protein [Rutidosis leptorrhynchoides]|uniref:uncharacterized protein n=1 Tax=Rutidosis leptorrhynchoides TaxID=125765 RepID=UPI003A9924C0
MEVVNGNKLCLCAILESHVLINKLNNICNNVFPNWQWLSNSNYCKGGMRIIVGWDPSVVTVMVLSASDQVIHCLLEMVTDKKQFYASFVYAHNLYGKRRALWHDLARHSAFVGSHPWVILGDFNVSLELEESSSGSSKVSLAMREFQECIEQIRMTDINHSGFQFTWNQCPNASTGILKKIDRVMGNDIFLNDFVNAFALFEPYRISDHCPAILRIPGTVVLKPKPFKFCNFVAKHDNFEETVRAAWGVEVHGCHMFKLVNKLKGLKKPLRKLAWQRGNLHKRVIELREKLDDAQRELDKNPNSIVARNSEAQCLRDFNDALIEEEVFLRQKEKSIGYEWVIHEHLFSKTISAEASTFMIREVKAKEVKDAIYNIGSDKSPGPDGFNAEFFKSAWHIVGDDVTRAVLDYFNNGRLLKQINHTVITLLPKVKTPDKVTDYRPISCCNVIYKCISKIITNRIKLSLDEVVGCNQSAFILGRTISDNILLTQELMKDYHTNRGVARCAFKVDIQKAYDTVDWVFLESILRRFGYLDTMVKWIMTCVTSTSFSIAVNGDLHGFFRGKRGLRQGDPMSPYLFTLVMEVLSLLLQESMTEENRFRFHPRCENLKIINLCFADDLFLFSHADSGSVKVIAEAL